MEGEEVKLLHHHVKQYEGTRYNGKREASYYITSYGRVARMSKTKGLKWMTTSKSTHKCGYYYQVRLPWMNHPVNIHRLVGSTFLPDFQENLFVCHKQENLPVEYINRVDNLFMGTHSDNMIDAYNKGRKTWSNQTYKHL
jgi:hypothetical protein